MFALRGAKMCPRFTPSNRQTNINNYKPFDTLTTCQIAIAFIRVRCACSWSFGLVPSSTLNKFLFERRGRSSMFVKARPGLINHTLILVCLKSDRQPSSYILNLVSPFKGNHCIVNISKYHSSDAVNYVKKFLIFGLLLRNKWSSCPYVRTNHGIFMRIFQWQDSFPLGYGPDKART